MTFKAKYEFLLENENVRRWYENIKARSSVHASVSLRVLGYYCYLNKLTPEDILKMAKNKKFKNHFTDFVRRLEAEGKAGSYISRFKKVLLNWIRFNEIVMDLKINIKGENENPTLENEKVPSKEELSKILRKATSRARVSITLMAFSGLRPESLGNYDGTDGIKLSDIKDLRINGTEIIFDKLPAMLVIRSKLSKARNQYFTFISEESSIYIKEYLIERLKSGEELTENSPILQFDSRGINHNDYLRTTLVTRDIREAIVSAELKMRPYVLRSYFATALDIAESKGFISHPWRMFIMGHKGDIEARYSTNKRLPPDMIDQIRESYKKCTKYLETRFSEPSENDAKFYLQTQLLLAVGYKQEEIEKIDLDHISDDDFQKLLKDKVFGALVNNGNKQKIIEMKEIEKYIEMGYEYLTSLPNGKAIIKLPF